MSLVLKVCLQCHSEPLAHTLKTFLARETRPIFDDDVAPSQRELFLAIEEIEYPHNIAVEGRQVFLEWYEEDRFSFEDLLPMLAIEGIELVAGVEVPDDPMAADIEEDMRWFWRPGPSGLQSVGEDQIRQSVSDTIVDRLAEQG